MTIEGNMGTGLPNASAAHMSFVEWVGTQNIDWLNITFGVIGVVGAVYGYLAWKDARKQKKTHDYLFKLAEQNIDKSITEHELAQRHQAVEDASARIEALQEQIRLDIPKAAKRAVLTDRLKSQVEAMSQNYNSVMQLKSEIALIGAPADLPKELLRAIEREIEPEYLARERRSRLKTNLSILTAGAAISSETLPHPVGRVLSGALLLVAVPIVIALMVLGLKERRRRDPAGTAKALAGGAIVVSGPLFILGAGAVLVALSDSHSAPVAGPLGVLALLIAAAALVFGIRMLRRTQWRRPFVKRASGQQA